MLSGAASPPKRKNKRMSVWSTKEKTEIIAISSGSETESDYEPLQPSQPIIKSRLPTPSTKSATAVKKIATPPVKAPPRRVDSTPSATARRGLSKKALHEQLVKYSNDLYISLNERVFGGRLPRLREAGKGEPDPNTCEIVWSNTLKKTAGRAVISR